MKMLPNSSFMTGHTKPLTYPRGNKALWSGLYENPLVCLNKALWSPYSWEDRGLVDVRQKVFHEFKNSHHWKSTLRFPTKCHPFGVEALVLDTQQKRGAPFRNSESRRVLKNFLTGRKSSPRPNWRFTDPFIGRMWRTHRELRRRREKVGWEMMRPGLPVKHFLARGKNRDDPDGTW